MKLALLTLMLALPAMAEESHLWLLAMTNVPGVEAMATPQTLYGVQVFMDSDDAKVTQFRVTLTVTLPDGSSQTFAGDVPRSPKPQGVVYSTAWSAYFAKDLDWTVTRLTVEEVR